MVLFLAEAKIMVTQRKTVLNIISGEPLGETRKVGKSAKFIMSTARCCICFWLHESKLFQCRLFDSLLRSLSSEFQPRTSNMLRLPKQVRNGLSHASSRLDV